ncbi:hypothetical protein EDC40_1124 [Aminobacter aminovorans]|uniref:Uncharacterized protein n=1 Tax=Aminobacter aminovorans TaxID=83263 RepID=A0A380WE19_AMIAI|nr:hypothetical protein EDC40_1124 [Aminobacter aminovorans]SUU87210.1 Uncharacterised protein [Aminobacter aminovorans]
MMRRKHPHSASLRSTPLPLPRGEERSAAIRALLVSSVEPALFLSPVERGRGVVRSEAERGSTCLAPRGTLRSLTLRTVEGAPRVRREPMS